METQKSDDWSWFKVILGKEGEEDREVRPSETGETGGLGMKVSVKVESELVCKYSFIKYLLFYSYFLLFILKLFILLLMLFWLVGA